MDGGMGWGAGLAGKVGCSAVGLAKEKRCLETGSAEPGLFERKAGMWVCWRVRTLGWGVCGNRRV